MSDRRNNTSLHLAPGVIDSAGKVHPTPVIVTIDSGGKVMSYKPLSGHEPAFTTVTNALLHLPTLTFRPL